MICLYDGKFGGKSPDMLGQKLNALKDTFKETDQISGYMRAYKR
jgi:hypothetical protein